MQYLYYLTTASCTQPHLLYNKLIHHANFDQPFSDTH